MGSETSDLVARWMRRATATLDRADLAPGQAARLGMLVDAWACSVAAAHSSSPAAGVPYPPWSTLIEAITKAADSRTGGWPQAGDGPLMRLWASISIIHADALRAAAVELSGADTEASLLATAYDTYTRAAAHGYRALARDDGFAATLATLLGAGRSSDIAGVASRRRPAARPRPESAVAGSWDMDRVVRLGAECNELRGALRRARSALVALPVPAHAQLRRQSLEIAGTTLVERYTAPSGHRRRRTPVLLVPPLLGRAALTELHPRGLVGELLARGLDLWVFDWQQFDRIRRDQHLEDLLARLRQAVSAVAGATRRTHIDLIGVCHGGVLSLTQAARHPRSVRALVTLATPVNFHTRGDAFSHWMRHLDLSGADDTPVPATLLAGLWLALRPLAFDTIKYRDLRRWMDDPSRIAHTLRVQHCMHQIGDQPRPLLREYIERFCVGNELMRDRGARGVRAPVLNVYARADRAVPPAATTALGSLITGSRYRQFGVRGGHLNLVAGAAGGRAAVAIDKFLHRAGTRG